MKAISKFTLFSVFLGVVLTQSSFAACFSEDNALIYNCERSNNTQADKLCAEKVQGGEERLFDYKLTNRCSQSRSKFLLGELDQLESGGLQSLEYNSYVEAVCLTFEQGEKRSCEYFDYEPASNYCAHFYGHKFIAYRVTDTCSVELADSLAGFDDSAELIIGLESPMKKINGFLSLIDRETLASNMEGKTTSLPVIENDFYTPIMKKTLELMGEVKRKLEDRSHLNIKFQVNSKDRFNKKHPLKLFREYLVQYVGFVMRVNKVYAHVAHKNHLVLRSYDFEKLKFLDLNLSKKWGRELVSQVQAYPLKADDGSFIFGLSEQEKQVVEYKAMENPQNSTDYAKLVSFLSLRDFLVNSWAIDKMSGHKNFEHQNFPLGKFLSFRKEKAGQPLSETPVVRELKNFDRLYNVYLGNLENLAKELEDLSLLEKKSLSKVISKVISSQEWLGQLISEFGNGDNEAYALENANFLIQVDDIYRNGQLLKDLSELFIFPEETADIRKLALKLTNYISKKRFEFLVDYFVGQHKWTDDANLQDVEKVLKQELTKEYKSGYKETLVDQLIPFLRKIFDDKKIAEEFYQQKVDETLAAAKDGVLGAYSLVSLGSENLDRISLNPSTIQELQQLFEYKMGRRYQDVQRTMNSQEKLTQKVNAFFVEISNKFKEEFIEQSAGEEKLKGTREEREAGLREIVVDRAFKYLKDKKIDIGEGIPEATLLARDRDIITSAYRIQVYRDGTPVTMHIDEFYRTFQEDTGIDIPRSNIVMRMDTLMGIAPLFEYSTRTHMDDFNNQVLISEAGEAYLSTPQVSLDDMKRVYLQSLDLTKHEIGESLRIIQEEKSKAEEEKSGDIINEEKELFSRVFEILNISKSKRKFVNLSRGFTKRVDEKKFMARILSNLGYSQSALLNASIETTEETTEYIYTSFGERMPMPSVEKVERKLLEKIAVHAYNPKRDTVDEKRAIDLIKKVIANAKKEIQGKLKAISSANYLNYKNNDDFISLFKASSAVRSNLKSSVGTSILNAKKIRKYDEQMAKDLRTWSEAVNEDYLDKALWVLGGIAIGGLVIAMGIMSFGVAVPVGLKMIAAGIMGFLSIEFYLSFPLVTLALYNRINNNFIEKPAQLQFSKSLALSQIESNVVVDWGQLDEEIKANKSGKVWTVALAPLDVLYGGMMVRQIRNNLGYTGRSAYQKMTGMRFRSYTPFERKIKQEGIKNYGVIRNAINRAKETYRSRVPRFQPVLPELLKTPALRAGLVRKFESLGIANRPWMIYDDILNYNNSLKDRFVLMDRFAKDTDKIASKAKLSGGLKFAELQEFGFKYGRFAYAPRGFWRSLKWKNIKNGKFIEYWTRRKDSLSKLRQLQGRLISRKTQKIDEVIQKVDEFKSLYAGKTANDDMAKKFVSYFTDDELLLLQWIAKKSTGPLKQFKSVFKQYKQVLEGLTPKGYSAGEAFRVHMGSDDLFMEDATKLKAFENETEDIVRFYETILSQSIIDTQDMRVVRSQLESELSNMFTTKPDGARIYFD